MMGKRFVASNGIRLEGDSTDIKNCIRIYADTYGNTLTNYDALDADESQALREFFQHERDRELGRWRDPESPDYVVYPPDYVAYPNEDTVVVLHEATGARISWTRGEAEQEVYGAMLGFVTANRYFEAHPVAKPWQDAEPGEVWEVTLEGEPHTLEMTCIDRDGDICFFTKSRLVLTHYPRIVWAGRLWPEVSNGG